MTCTTAYPMWDFLRCSLSLIDCSRPNVARKRIQHVHHTSCCRYLPRSRALRKLDKPESIHDEQECKWSIQFRFLIYFTPARSTLSLVSYWRQNIGCSQVEIGWCANSLSFWWDKVLVLLVFFTNDQACVCFQGLLCGLDQ